MTHVTLERFVAVLLPHKAKSLFTINRAKISVIITLVIICLISSPNIITYYYEEGYCYTDIMGPLAEYVLWYLILFKAAIPLGIIFFANIGIIIGVAKARRDRQRHLSTSQGDDKSHSLTIILLTISISFFILSLPQALYAAIEVPIITKNGDRFFPGSKLFAQLWLTFNVCRYLLNINYAINFFLYCLSGSRFRKEFVAMITCGKFRGDESV